LYDNAGLQSEYKFFGGKITISGIYDNNNLWLQKWVRPVKNGVTVILISLAATTRYYYLRYQRLKLTEYTIKEGRVKVGLRQLTK